MKAKETYLFFIAQVFASDDSIVELPIGLTEEEIMKINNMNIREELSIFNSCEDIKDNNNFNSWYLFIS